MNSSPTEDRGAPVQSEIERLHSYLTSAAGELDQDSTPIKSVSDATIEEKVSAAEGKAKQTFDFREKFFRTVSRSLIGALIACGLTMLAYVFSEWGTLDAAVMISFNAAVVAQVVGLAFILAKYLFPEGGAD